MSLAFRVWKSGTKLHRPFPQDSTPTVRLLSGPEDMPLSPDGVAPFCMCQQSWHTSWGATRPFATTLGGVASACFLTHPVVLLISVCCFCLFVF